MLGKVIDMPNDSVTQENLKQFFLESKISFIWLVAYFYTLQHF